MIPFLSPAGASCYARVVLTTLFFLFFTMARAEQNEAPVKVVTSFSILADWVRQIGGDRVAVHSLVGLDEDAHVFRAAPKDVREVREADLLVVNGLGFEGWLERLVGASGFKGEVLVASEGVEVIRNENKQGALEGHYHHHDRHHNHGHQGSGGGQHSADPHAWHSLNAAKHYTSNIAKALSRNDPAHSAKYSQSLAVYHQQLDALSDEYKQVLSDIASANRHIVVPHDSFAYLAKEFDLHIHSLQGVSTEAEASAKQIAAIVRQIRKNNIRALFLENVANPRLIEQVQRETGVSIGGELISDALSRNTAETYLDLMRHNLRRIATALSSAGHIQTAP